MIPAEQRIECFHCRMPMNRIELTRDHWIPKSAYRELCGAIQLELHAQPWFPPGNIVLSCKPCNRRKGSRVPKIALDFLRAKGVTGGGLRGGHYCRVRKEFRYTGV